MKPWLNLGILVGICWAVSYLVYQLGRQSVLHEIDALLKQDEDRHTVP